jgi:Fe-S cluster biogenesis protein NfuA
MWNIIKEVRSTEDNVQYTAYGIQCGDCVISDITTDYEVIKEFVEKINEFELSTINAIDVVEDFIADM